MPVKLPNSRVGGGTVMPTKLPGCWADVGGVMPNELPGRWAGGGRCRTGTMINHGRLM